MWGLEAISEVRQFVDWVAKNVPDFTNHCQEEALRTRASDRLSFTHPRDRALQVRPDDCGTVRGELARLCRDAEVKGTLLLAPEGINRMIAGSDRANPLRSWRSFGAFEAFPIWT